MSETEPIHTAIHGPGNVVFAGAGPGDPELLTLKAAKALSRANVVITDRLVSQQILELHVPATAKIIFVGKQGKNENSCSQTEINDLLVQYAREGNSVVRLKGGDISFFSNILDELSTLVKNGIAYQLIPGISAASGAAASAGIPLTARGHSTSVRFLTAYQDEILPEKDWAELAHTTDTLVFYMSANRAAEIVSRLLKNGIRKDIHIAVIEQATTPYQKVFSCEIGSYLESNHREKYKSPSLILIGSVVALSESFAWVPNSKMEGSYFKELSRIQPLIPIIEEFINLKAC